ncbi:SPOR domain-containing protein [Pseudomonas sp. UBA6323]|uniref:SPOR domain-containing protein n=1 Tax=Pseudomonas sp. UBA6323 TaxID=1947329 RepID=UPI0025D63EF0|nr:SPOR domain-containing protein [Pseudomonas sp. UBA6323]
MAMLDKGLKQRMVGALVLVALAVIFLPMLLSREDEMRRVVVEAPAMPQAPEAAEIVVEPAEVVEPEQLPQEPVPVEEVEPQIVEVPEQPKQTPPPAAEPSKPEPARTEPAKTEQAVTTAPAKPEGRLDANSLPISWSVQLASLSSRGGAENLQKTLRSQGYNAYIRTFDGMNRVFVGPLIERAEAERLRDQLNRQHKLSGFVVRFQPEAG